MPMIDATDYVRTMEPFLKKLPELLRTPAAAPGLRFYGTGESVHWPVQSNCNIFAALAVLSTAPELPPEKREECEILALRLLRYTLRTHLTGDLDATDGKRWGHHWISVLGLERMNHGLNAIRDRLTAEDHARLRTLMLSESEWLLDFYPVEADMIGTSGKNRPESNIWNGGMLLRTALEYPDAPRAGEFLEKSTRFLLNGLSHPLDAAGETRYRGRPLREWHVGPNFTLNWSLDHHGYLNVGYMIIALSNLAMLHFHCRERGFTPPPELYHHVKDLWETVREFTFPDGRLLRIGGDTRSRYTYCQCYAVPVWLMAADLFGDPAAIRFENGYLALIRKEQAASGDGSFYGRRLADLGRISYYYWTRLESDPFLALSCGARWRRLFRLPAEAPPENPRDFEWNDAFHGAALIKTPDSVRSWVWRGAQGPTGLCVPAERSDLAEWQESLHGNLDTTVNPATEATNFEMHPFPGGFLTWGESFHREASPLGEGELSHPFARHLSAVAALPDRKTLLVLEYAQMTAETTLEAVCGLSWKLPNDLYNDGIRRIRTTERQFQYTGPSGREETFFLGSSATVDEALTATILYGESPLALRRTSGRNIRLKYAPALLSLYAEELCRECRTGNFRPRAGEVLFDSGSAVSTGATGATPIACRQTGTLRQVRVRGCDAAEYLMAANWGDTPVRAELPPDAIALAGGGDAEIPPRSARLWKLG